jgi:hypothetical protein
MGADGLGVELGDVRVEWDREGLEALADTSAVVESDRLRRVGGEIDPGRHELLRLISVGLDDGTVLGVASLRPAGAAGHGDEVTRAVLARPDSEPVAVEEALVSTEYDGAGLIRRVGAELWTGSEAGPLRLAADRGAGSSAGDGDPGAATELIARLDGAEGRGLYEIRRPA